MCLFYRISLVTCFMLLNSVFIHAQTGFIGKIKLGLNATQIHGDGLFGYDKLGLIGGAQLSYELNSRFDMGFEFLLTQKGSQAKISFSSPADIQRTTLNYIEFPLFITVKDWFIEDGGYYKIKAHGGFSYAYLMDVSSSNGLYQNDLGNFNNTDFALLIGVSYALGPKMEATARYTNSVTKIYKNENLETDGLLNYLWSFTLDYKL